MPCQRLLGGRSTCAPEPPRISCQSLGGGIQQTPQIRGNMEGVTEGLVQVGVAVWITILGSVKWARVLAGQGLEVCCLSTSLVCVCVLVCLWGLPMWVASG